MQIKLVPEKKNPSAISLEDCLNTVRVQVSPGVVSGHA